MKKLLKIFIFIMVLILSISANVLACDLSGKKIGLGKDYKNFFERKDIKQDVFSEKYSEINIRGTDICDDLKKTEVTVIITDSEIAGIKIDKRNSSKKILYHSAVDTFGLPNNEPNFEKVATSYAGFFDKGKIYATYKFSKTPEGDNESIFIMSKDLMGKIDKYNKTKESDEK